MYGAERTRARKFSWWDENEDEMYIKICAMQGNRIGLILL